MLNKLAGKIMLGAFSALIMTGCIPKKVEEKVEEKPMTAFERELSTAATSASDAQSMLARVNNAVGMTSMNSNQSGQATWQETQKLKGLQDTIDFDWVGDVHGFARGIARYVKGWDVQVIGRKPITAPMVSIFAKGVTVQHILEDAGTQLGSRMDVIINPHAKPNPIIKFRYMEEQVHD